MIIRLRSRDGLERIEVEDGGTIMVRGNEEGLRLADTFRQWKRASIYSVARWHFCLPCHYPSPASSCADIQALKQAIHTKLGIPLGDIHLSKNPALLTTQDNPMVRAGEVTLW